MKALVVAEPWIRNDPGRHEDVKDAEQGYAPARACSAPQGLRTDRRRSHSGRLPRTNHGQRLPAGAGPTPYPAEQPALGIANGYLIPWVLSDAGPLPQPASYRHPIAL